MTNVTISVPKEVADKILKDPEAAIQFLKENGFDVLSISPSGNTTIKVYMVYCATGCSCCSRNNHYRGPFSRPEIADARVVEYSNQRVLASQFAPNGHYTVSEWTAEVLPDGRLIIDEHVSNGFKDNEIPGTNEEIFHEMGN